MCQTEKLIKTECRPLDPPKPFDSVRDFLIRTYMEVEGDEKRYSCGNGWDVFLFLLKNENRRKFFCIGNTRYQSPQNRNTCTKLTIIKIITTLGWRTRALDLWYSHGHILALPYQNTLLNRFDSNNDVVWRTRFPRQRYSSSHPININYTLFWLDFPPIR